MGMTDSCSPWPSSFGLEQQVPLGLKSLLSFRVYFHRELVCRSCEGRRLDLLTLTSTNGSVATREGYLDQLFPSEQEADGEERPRPFLFPEKKVVFVSSRVHPGETQSR